MDRRRWLVDLDDIRAGGRERADFGGKQWDERLRGRNAIFVDLSGARHETAGQRERSGERDLEVMCRALPRGVEFRHDAESSRGIDRLEDAEAMLLVVAADAELPVGCERLDTADPLIELRSEEPG